MSSLYILPLSLTGINIISLLLFTFLFLSWLFPSIDLWRTKVQGEKGPSSFVDRLEIFRGFVAVKFSIYAKARLHCMPLYMIEWNRQDMASKLIKHIEQLCIYILVPQSIKNEEELNWVIWRAKKMFLRSCCLYSYLWINGTSCIVLDWLIMWSNHHLIYSFYLLTSNLFVLNWHAST